MARTIAIGTQDFGRIIENGCFYVDKTMFIKEWWENQDEVTLITRPRRFGKTLAMSMLEYFLSVKHAGRGDLFQHLDIWKEEKYRGLQGTFPVIFLSFAGAKGTNYQTVRKMICQMFVNLYADFRFLLKGKLSGNADEVFFERMISSDMDDADAALALGQLSRILYQCYGKKTIILLDEYYSPMQEAYAGGYWEQMAGFIRGIFNSAFKTNPYLERAVLTGVTRISRESVFSDLNSLEAVTSVSEKYETAFGFTEKETETALREFGLQEKLSEVKKWYDGFRFGSCVSIYNPWSITQFLDKGKFAPYWANTSSNRLAGKLIQEGGTDVKRIMEDLLEGKPFCAAVDEQIVFGELEHNPDAVWSLLLAGGYLKIAGCETENPDFIKGGIVCQLMLTNLEIVFTFRKMIRGWFASCSSSYNDFIKSLLTGDLEGMNGYMNRIALAVFSSFDAGNRPSGKSEPEKFYHGFVLGLIVELAGRYEITSNRESGFGRYDVLLRPRDGGDGIILEFKVIQPEKEKSLQETADAALRQIVDKQYASLLEQSGCGSGDIRIYGFAFRGKEVLVSGGFLRDYASGRNWR